MYDQHIILDFEMNPVFKKNKEVRKAICQEIIKIGVLKLNSRFEIVDTITYFIRPIYNDNVTGYITELTGITIMDICNAMEFAEVVRKFQKWIGNETTRVYSWGDCDLRQMQKECEYKNIEMPINMRRWVDFQMLYSRVMGLNYNQRMSLCYAAPSMV